MALHCFPVVLGLLSLSKKTSFSYPEMAEERPCDKVLLLSRRTVNSKKVAVSSQANLFLWSLQLSRSNICKQEVAEMRKCRSHKGCQGWEG